MAKVMTAAPNPYEPALVQTEVMVTSAPLGKPRATLVGVFVVTLSAVVVGEVLSLVALIPPLSHWLDLDGEFGALILIAMPVLAGGCGALAGLVLGLFYPSTWSRLASAIAGSLPAMLFCANGYQSRESVVSVTAIGGIMILATTTGVMFTHSVLVSIERRRTSHKPASQTNPSAREGILVAMIATGIATASLIFDVWLWWTLESESRLGIEFRLTEVFGLGLLAVATNVYVWAAYPNRKRTAVIVGSASFAGCVVVLSLWFLYLIHDAPAT